MRERALRGRAVIRVRFSAACIRLPELGGHFFKSLANPRLICRSANEFYRVKPFRSYRCNIAVEANCSASDKLFASRSKSIRDRRFGILGF